MNIRRSIGRYQLDSLLAAGAMGEVYRGYDPVIDRPVAIKLLRRELVQAHDAESWLQRFRREAQAAGRRFHPNIVTVLDFGEEAGVPYLAMEFVEGDSLDRLLKSSGRLEVERSLSIMTQTLSALAFIHGDGVVHRDIKPANIMIMPNGHVKLADFSIARVDSSELTIVGDVLGTPAYMAPEQLTGAPFDHRIDLFAAGVVLYEMVTGAKPFRGRSITEIISHIQTRGPEDILIHAPEAPTALQTVLNTALAFEPERRFGRAADFAKRLAEVAAANREFPSGRDLDSEAGRLPIDPVVASNDGNSPLDAEKLGKIERELAIHIGPLARIAVQRASKIFHSFDELCQSVSAYIENTDDRTAFLAGTPARHDSRTEAGAAGSSGKAASSHSAINFDHPPAGLGMDILTRIEMNLTQFIGPVARVIVRQQLAKSASLFDLYRDLASYIPDERDRAEFLKQQPVG
jgi:eukaryotic-like serine/threonine-protein kinase